MSCQAFRKCLKCISINTNAKLSFLNSFLTRKVSQAAQSFDDEENRNLQSQALYEPIFEKPFQLPSHGVVNVVISGYDFVVLEHFQSYIHKLARLMGFRIANTWASPARKFQCTVYKIGSTAISDQFELPKYERNVQIEDFFSSTGSLLIDIIKTDLPEGVTLNIKPHTAADEEYRYIPDLELKEQQKLLETVNIMEESEERIEEVADVEAERIGKLAISKSDEIEIDRENLADVVESEEPFLTVDISDALSEKDKIKFTVHMKTNFPAFTQKETSVVREHDEFLWLYDAIEENPLYAGYIVSWSLFQKIPPPPPRPDFDTSREKLQKLSEGEPTMTREEFAKMKAELEAEYLATFKKTVAMHGLFLNRLATHPVLKDDSNFQIFLEYQDANGLNIRGKNKKEKLESIWKRFSTSADEVLLSNQKDSEPFFEHEKNYLVEYYGHVREATSRSDKMTKHLKNMSDVMMKICSSLETLGGIEKSPELSKTVLKVAETYEKCRKLEARVSSDFDLKLSDTLRYFMRDTQAAKDLLYRRLRCLATLETASRNLDQLDKQNASKEYEAISEKAKQELEEYKVRRVAAFKKSLVELAELQHKHAKTQVHVLKSAIASLKEMSA
ncbi:Sorting nexin-6 [Trichinella britovi]|uniref:Sorting nexin-6 n=2 Tax=Trichinella TaxID=6333 RepID=A0A0V1CWC9_TRIBR|nr:Sorting nexin-6 [Trichinella murrelli]KRX61776.1 Sorting nexin-6 [Trichinella sp. T9]KRY53621.1 Sorting nexin-6 [Trichinella britovi]KRZ95469.1 Sorting nexin-6 [Trichinella sp. T8]